MKNIIIFILCAALAVMVWMLLKKEVKVQKEAAPTTIKSNVELEAKELSRDVDSAGLQHTIYKESEAILRIIELKVEDREKVDSLMEVVGITEKQLKSVTNLYGRVQAENLELKRRRHDTAYVYKDKYLSLAFTPQNDTLALADFGYDYDFQSVSYDPRKWYQKILNWNDVTYTNIWSTDKRATTRGYEKLTIVDKIPDLGYTIKASAMYLPEWGIASFGPKVNIRYKRINASGSYMYFPVHKEWFPVVGIDIDLLSN